MTSIVNGNLDSVLTRSGLGVDVADVDLLIGQMGTMDPPLDRRWARAGIGAREMAGIILHICLNTPRLWAGLACSGLRWPACGGCFLCRAKLCSTWPAQGF